MSKLTRIASDGKPVTLTDTTTNGKTKLSIIAPTMERDISRANATITVDPCWELVYDANGYCVKCTNIGDKSKLPKPLPLSATKRLMRAGKIVLL